MSEQITGGAAPFSRGPGGRGDDVGRPIKTKFSNALGSQRGLEGGRSSAAAKTLGTAESRPAIGQHRAMIGDMGAQSAAKLTPRPGSAALGGANLNPVAARALGGDNAKTATNAPAGASGFAAFGDKSKKAGQTEKSGDTTLSTRGAGSGSSRSRAAKSEPEATAASIGRMMKGLQEMAARIAAERPFATRSRLGGQPAATGEGAETATIGDKETLGQGVGETERSESTLFAANDGETVVEDSGAPDERVEQIAGDDASLSAEGEAETEAADEAETAAAPEPEAPGEAEDAEALSETGEAEAASETKDPEAVGDAEAEAEAGTVSEAEGAETPGEAQGPEAASEAEDARSMGEGEETNPVKGAGEAASLEAQETPTEAETADAAQGAPTEDKDAAAAQDSAKAEDADERPESLRAELRTSDGAATPDRELTSREKAELAIQKAVSELMLETILGDAEAAASMVETPSEQADSPLLAAGLAPAKSKKTDNEPKPETLRDKPSALFAVAENPFGIDSVAINDEGEVRMWGAGIAVMFSGAEVLEDQRIAAYDGDGVFRGQPAVFEPLGDMSYSLLISPMPQRLSAVRIEARANGTDISVIAYSSGGG